MKKCPKCSLNLEDSVTKCTYCGYDFTEDAIKEPIEVIKPEEEAATEAPTQPIAESPVQPEYNHYQGDYQQIPPPPYNQQGYNPYGTPPHKFCPRCGNRCDPNAVICVKCGMSFGQNPQQLVDDNPSTLLKVICFFVPIVALVLYLAEKDNKPVSAKAYGKWGLIGLAVSVGFSIISVIFSLIIALFNFGTLYTYDFEEFGNYYHQILVNLLK